MTDSVYKFYVGIDVSKEKVDVAISDHPTVLRFSNNQEGLNELVKVLRSKKRTLIVLEATGGYEKFVANGLKQKKFNVAVVKNFTNFPRRSVQNLIYATKPLKKEG